MNQFIFYLFSWCLLLASLALFFGMLITICIEEFNRVIDEISAYVNIMILFNTIIFLRYIILGIIFYEDNFMLINICFIGVLLVIKPIKKRRRQNEIKRIMEKYGRRNEKK